MAVNGFRTLGALASVLLVGIVPLQAQMPSVESFDTAQARHLLQRATYGVTKANLTELLSIGPESWLERQLNPKQLPDREVEDLLSEYPAAMIPGGEVYRRYTPAGSLQQLAGAGTSAQEAAAMEQLRAAAKGRAQAMREMVGARLVRAVYSERQLQEVMVGFWLDHFNVYLAKPGVRWVAAEFEREAIRPHVFGTFEELLVAVASHPAMLIYLDNWRSTAEGQADTRRAMRRGGLPARPGRAGMAGGMMGRSQAGGAGAMQPQGQRRQGGINENFARELLELHTLGVDGGYTQEDVIAVARAFTGWSVIQPREGNRDAEFRFIFRSSVHDRGEKEVLGQNFPAGGGQEEGLAVLQLLANHPSTARHISRKLAERFVRDEPPIELVDTLTSVFLSTGGDLREVTRTLFTSPAFWDPANMGTKIKRPFELVVSALRATEATVLRTQGLQQTLQSFGHVPYMEASPAGYPAQKADWVNSGGMLNRMNFGLEIGTGSYRGVRLPRGDWWQSAVRAGSREEMVSTLAQQILPGVDTRELESIIISDLANLEGARTEELAGRALGLLIGSPEFQRH